MPVERDNPLKCKDCGKMFRTPGARLFHKYRSHEEQRVCEECGGSYWNVQRAQHLTSLRHQGLPRLPRGPLRGGWEGSRGRMEEVWRAVTVYNFLTRGGGVGVGEEGLELEDEGVEGDMEFRERCWKKLNLLLPGLTQEGEVMEVLGEEEVEEIVRGEKVTKEQIEVVLGVHTSASKDNNYIRQELFLPQLLLIYWIRDVCLTSSGFVERKI